MTHKLFQRLICAFLALLMVGALIPARTFADNTDPAETVPAPTENTTVPTEEVPVPSEDVTEPTEELLPPEETVPEETEPVPETPEELLVYNLENMYQEILLRTEMESLSGFCATLVAWQVHLSGITHDVVRGDGKDQFDNYRDLDKTSGGYYVHTLSGEDYTLLEALMTITDDGNRDVSNILIGFEKTNSAAGSLYGHTVFIGGIIDGMVYYIESNEYTVGGVVYPEGTPIVCPIWQFAAQYAGWATFEGAVEFSQTHYLEGCEILPTEVYIRTDAETELRTEPCYGEDSVWSFGVRTVRAGEVFPVDAIVEDTRGRYWYRAALEKPLYFPVEDTSLVYSSYSGSQAVDMEIPTELEAGSKFRFSGVVSAGGSSLRMVRCQVFTGHAGEGTLVRNAAVTVDKQTYELHSLSKKLQLEDLEPGVYHIVISVILRNRFMRDGEMKYRSKLEDIWTAEFRIYEEGEEDPGLMPVLLEPQGGSCAAQQILMAPGGAVPAIAAPTRTGYSFDGWFRDSYGVVRGPLTAMGSAGPAYACWTPDTQGLDGWHRVDGIWRCYEAGAPVTGLVRWEGLTCYIHEDGSRHTGWLEVDGKSYYFFENGISACGLTVIDGQEYYCGMDGALSEEKVMN